MSRYVREKCTDITKKNQDKSTKFVIIDLFTYVIPMYKKLGIFDR